VAHIPDKKVWTGFLLGAYNSLELLFHVVSLSFVEQSDLQSLRSLIKNSEVPVLLCFGASWCGPCRMLLPVLESLDSINKKIKIVKIDIGESLEIAEAFEIQNIPVLLLFKEGKQMSKKSGFVTLPNMSKWISDLDR
jgi:thioredoxin 1